MMTLPELPPPDEAFHRWLVLQSKMTLRGPEGMAESAWFAALSYADARAALAVQAERERCAKICDAEASRIADGATWCGYADTGARLCAAAIRNQPEVET